MGAFTQMDESSVVGNEAIDLDMILSSQWRQISKQQRQRSSLFWRSFILERSLSQDVL